MNIVIEQWKGTTLCYDNVSGEYLVRDVINGHIKYFKDLNSAKAFYNMLTYRKNMN